MKGLLLALQFLTIIPIRIGGAVSERELARSSLFFPLVGLFQGLLSALTAFILIRFFPPEITSGFIVALLIFINGGFDIDGLSDLFDSLSVKSSGDPTRDRERRLSVMKESTAGTMGVVAVVLAVLMKFLLIKGILSGFSLYTACSMLTLMPVFSRWVTVVSMFYGKPAREDGLGLIFIRYADIKTLIYSTALTLMTALVTPAFYLLHEYTVSAYLGLLVVLFILLYLFSLIFTRQSERIYGGLTGDHFGAMTELSEILFLMVVYLWFRHYT